MSDLVLIQPEGQAWWSGGEVPFRVVELNGKREVMVNVTAMLAGVGKVWSHYKALKGTEELIFHAESVLGIPRTELIQTIQGGDPQFQGTWAIKTIALAAAAWASTPLHWWVLETALAKLEGRDNAPTPGSPSAVVILRTMADALDRQDQINGRHDQQFTDVYQQLGTFQKQLNLLLPAPKKKVTPTKATKDLLWSVWEDHFSNVCPCCKEPTRKELMEIEHWNSSQQAGHDDLWVTCRSCNVKMGKPVGDGGRKRTEDQRRAWDTFQDLKNLRVKSDAGQQTSIFDHF
jgi:hypothetical protein